MYNILLSPQDALIDTLKKTHVHFVYTMNPHALAGLSTIPHGSSSVDDVTLDVPETRGQIRGAQILLAMRHHRQGN